MRKAPLLSALFFLLSFTLSGFAFNGFIITLDGKHISGKIEQVNTIDEYIDVIFINDFGTKYNIHPALIKGFVYAKDGQTFVYESFYQHRKWLFLRLIYRGKELSLFKMPEIQVDWKVVKGSLVSYSPNQKRYWLKNGRRPAFELKRRHFKKRLSKIIKRKAPKLAKKIGTKGYRYHDLPQILDKYNMIVNSGIKKL